MRFFITSCAVLGAMATSAAAQDAVCANLPAGAWIGGSRDASDIATSADMLETLSLAPSGQKIVSNFTVSAASDLRFEAVGAMSGDTVIDLFDASGELLGSDDDGGGGVSSRLEMALDPGDYCLQTSAYDDGILSATIRIGRQEHEALTVGASRGGAGSPPEGCEDAPILVVAPGPDGRFEPQSLVDRVEDMPTLRLSMTGEAPILIEAINTDADPTLGVYDFEDGSELHYNDDFDGLNAGVEIPQGLGEGVYCLTLGALSDETVPVEVKVSYYDPEAAKIRKVRLGDALPAEDGSYPVTDMGVLNGRSNVELPMGSDALWFKIEVEEAALLRIDAAGLGDEDDPRVELFDDLGEELAANEDISADNYASRLYHELFPGVYFFNVTNYHSGDTTMRVSVREYQAVRRR